MPRPKGTAPRLVAQQARQAKHREKLKLIGKPEASQVDVAVASAVAKAAMWLASRSESGAIGENDPRRHLLKKIVVTATQELVSSGCDRAEAQKKIASRFRSARKRRSPPITS